MSRAAIPDLITVVGTSYFQPIADLIDKLLAKPAPDPYPAGTSSMENGYAASIVVLVVATLESFVSRLRFLRNAEIVPSKDVPDVLQILFPDLPNKDELSEVFLLRNIVVHNHVWHLDVSDVERDGAPTIANPQDLKFHTKKNYREVVDVSVRRTRILGLNANPTAVDRNDVWVVFNVVWNMLLFMNSKDFAHTPLGGQTVKFRDSYRQFGELRDEFMGTHARKP